MKRVVCQKRRRMVSILLVLCLLCGCAVLWAKTMIPVGCSVRWQWMRRLVFFDELKARHALPGFISAVSKQQLCLFLVWNKINHHANQNNHHTDKLLHGHPFVEGQVGQEAGADGLPKDTHGHRGGGHLF